jgi:uncharacterized protein (TIGR03086 family)
MHGGFLQQDMLSVVHHETVLDAFTRVIAEVEALVVAVRPEQLSAPTPCSEFRVRALINHLIFENLAHAALADGAAIPEPDRTADYVGEDHVAAYVDSARAVRAAFGRPGMVTQRYGPMEAPGSMLVQQLIIELLSHGWDLATATGQRTDLAPDVAEDALLVVQSWYRDQPRGPGNAFGPEQPAPVGASAADRLAAYLGRVVA